MTTQKQQAANKANATKSTGPQTQDGKAVVSMNALRHGLLSQRLFLADESPDDFGGLQDDLRKSLSPVGVLELALVEKIAVALWKQRRMVAAESAAIELARTMRREDNRKAIKVAMGLGYADADVTEAELDPMSQDDLDTLAWCKGVQAEYLALADAVLETRDLAALAKNAPLIADQLKDEADTEGMPLETYLGQLEDGLAEWAYRLKEWARKEQAKLVRRPQVQAIAKLVLAERSAPISNELMLRYQVALDGELYRAVEQLRKQQEWRIRSGIEVEAELVEAAA